MDKKTKIQTVISLVLVVLITGLAYWAQVPSSDLKTQVIDVDTVLVRLQDFAYDPDIVRVDQNTLVTWVNDESEGNSDVKHNVTSFDPDDSTQAGVLFESDILEQGDEFEFLFTDPGVYNYFNGPYPFMTGKVCVGDESEIADEDCSVEKTDLEIDVAEVVVEEEEEVVVLPLVDDVDDDALADDDTDTAALADDDDDDATAALVDEDLTALDETLFGAADEDFDTSDTLALTDDGMVFVAADQSVSETQADGSDLADSGPEDLFYLIPLLFSLFVAKKYVYGNR